MKNKCLIILAIFTLTATLAFAREMETEQLVCSLEHANGPGISTSCVSKVSIEKDKAEKKLIDLQIKKVKKEIERMEREEKLRIAEDKKNP